jgi:hypothetical protein
MAVCTSDYDLDGDPDIAITHGFQNQTTWAGVYLLENDGYGYFNYMDSIFDSVGNWMMFADNVTNSNYPDLIYLFNKSVNILSTDGENFTTTSYLSGPEVSSGSFAMGDINGDSNKDILFYSHLEQYWGIIYNQENTSFSEPEYYNLPHPPIGITAGELNNDNRDDIVICGLESNVFFSTDTGFIEKPLFHHAQYPIVADFDNDNNNDIVTFSSIASICFVHLYKNIDNTMEFDTVNNFLVQEGCSKYFVEDFNNDTLLDILFLLTNFPKGYLLYYNLGNFQFGDSVYIAMQAYGEAWRNTACADLDGNGYMDIVTTRQNFDTTTVPSILEILFNDGQGNFVENPITGIQTSNFKPQTSSLFCYPNPYSGKTTIYYKVECDGVVELNVYNIIGQLVRNVNEGTKTKGTHFIDFDATGLKNGIYFYSISINGNTTDSKKMTVMK